MIEMGKQSSNALLPWIPLITGLGAVVLAALGNSVIEWLKAHLSDVRGRRISRRILLTDLKLHEQRVSGSFNMVSAVDADAGGTGYSIPVRESFPYLEMVGKDLGLLDENVRIR